VVAADIQTSWTPPQVPGQGNPTTPVATAPREQDAVSAWLDRAVAAAGHGIQQRRLDVPVGAGKLLQATPKASSRI